MFFKKKEFDIATLIKKGNFTKASSQIDLLIRKKKEFYLCHKTWLTINSGSQFNVEEININKNRLSEDFHETIRLYIFVIGTFWQKDFKKEYLKAAKQIILKISQYLRYHIFDEVYFDPELRNNLQDFIEVVEKLKLLEDKADLSAIKAQLSSTLLQMGLIEKYMLGEDMLQYAESYETVGLSTKSIEIYKGILNDFKSNSSKVSSGLFPEIQRIDDPTENELKIIQTAKESLIRLGVVQ